MRFIVLFLCGIAAWAADPFSGDWKLNPAKSSAADGKSIKAGRALIEPDGSGGFQQLDETVFADGTILRFTSRAQFDGSPGDAFLEDHSFNLSSRRIDASTFETALLDPKSGKPSGTLRFSATPGELTLVWSDEHSSPIRKLIYGRAPEGPMLEPGKTVEHDFGPAAVSEYRVALKAGEYCEGSVDQKGGSVNSAAYAPGGEKIRGFGGPPTGKSNFAIEAPVAGTYRIVLRSAAKPASSYAITLDRIVSIEERLRPTAAKDRFVSPRIDALRKEVEGGNKEAVAKFWSEVEQHGAPLVEPVPDNTTDDLVTFLWRARGETHNVLILWAPYVSSRIDDFKMTRLGETDVWYRTLKIRKGARFVYQLSPNDPLTFEPSKARIATVQADPLNPRRWFDNPGSTKFEYQSVVELPEARPQPYSAKRKDVAAGTIEKTRIKSELLGNERELAIYTPPGYRRDGTPNGLLVVFDEGSYLTLVPTPVILDNLIAEKKIAPMVAVLIANPDQETRTRELPPNPKFADFLNNELVAWMRRNYNITKDPSQTVVAGSSFGGIASVYAGLRHPETFGNILCQSGSFWWSSAKPAPYDEPNYLAREFLKIPKLPLKFYMDAGSFEVDLDGNGGAILEPSRHMRDVLLARGYEVHYQENVGGHDYLSWRGSLADGLIALVGAPK